MLAYLSERGFRRTAQREAIIDAALGTTEHFSAEQLLEISRQIDPSVSRATIYRTLSLLVDSGALKELDLGGGYKVYDPNFAEHPHHNHLICLDCEKIFEFEDLNIELLENCITRRLGFSPTRKHVTIQATCDRLKAEGACENRKPHPSKRTKKPPSGKSR